MIIFIIGFFSIEKIIQFVLRTSHPFCEHRFSLPQRSFLPPTARPTESCTSAVTPPNQAPRNHPQFSSTPTLNPYRIEKGKSFFPKNPNLFSPVSSSELVSSTSSSNSDNQGTFSPDLQPSLEILGGQRKPPVKIVPLPNFEPLIQVMKAIYEGKAK